MGAMFPTIWLCLGTVARFFCKRRSLLLENLALRQQLTVFKRRHPRPRLNLLDKLFWIAARKIWSDWKRSLVIVLPDTVVQWHRAGFKRYWTLLSKSWRPRVADFESRKTFGSWSSKWSPRIRPGEHLGFMGSFSCSAL